MAEARSASTQAIRAAKKHIIAIGLSCWQKGWVAGTGGNISLRISENEILCTASGVSKGMLTPADICLIDRSGNLMEKSKAQPSSEIKMHLRVMLERPDIKAVIHAHPPHATARAITGTPLTQNILPEIVVELGSIPIVPYGTPSTTEIPDRLAPFLADYDAWLLQNHGALTAGNDLMQAYFRMESLELYAQTLSIAKGLGKVTTLGRAQVKALIDLREKFGITDKKNVVLPRD